MTQQKKQPEVAMGFENSSSWCKGRDCHSPCVPNVNIKASTFQWAAVQLSPGKQCRAPQRRRTSGDCILLVEFQQASKILGSENYGRPSSAPVVIVGVKIKNAIQCPRWLDKRVQCCRYRARVWERSRRQQKPDRIIANTLLPMMAELPGMINEGIKVTFTLLNKIYWIAL